MNMKRWMLAIVVAGVVGSGSGVAQAADVSWLDEMRTPPQVVKHVMPVYPEDARAEGVEGQVVVRVTISKEGTAIRPQIVVSSGDPRLDRAAIDSILAWKFKPATLNGMKESAEVQIPLQFRLVDPEPPAEEAATEAR